jgi:hypothetical protein
MFCVSPTCLLVFLIVWFVVMLIASFGQDGLPNSIWMWLMFFNALILSPVAFAYGEWEVGAVLVFVFGAVIALGGIEITGAEICDCCTNCGSNIWFSLEDCFGGCVHTGGTVCPA